MKKHLRFSFLILGLVLSVAACSSTPVLDTSGDYTFTHDITDEKFDKILDTFSKKDEQYAGFGSVYQLYATLKNSAVIEAQLMRQAQDFKWTREHFFKEREKASQEMSNESEVFLSFFSPVVENENLHSGKSIWKIYLVSEGTRYEGKVQKSLDALAQLQRLYPQHSKFFSAYTVKFKVPMSKVQQSNSQFILTGP
ncbi:MAG: hypothetical protein AB7F59_07365, partial [Bdellovibrionales bacterium]